MTVPSLAVPASWHCAATAFLTGRLFRRTPVRIAWVPGGWFTDDPFDCMIDEMKVRRLAPGLRFERVWTA